MKTIIENKTFIYHLFKHSQKASIEYDFFSGFLGFLHQNLFEKGLLQNYRICYDVSLWGFDYTVFLNPELGFDLDQHVYLKNPTNLEELLKQYPIDNVIESTMSKYCLEKDSQMKSHMETNKDEDQKKLLKK